MLKIKLTRLGKKGQPFYRIIITEQRSKRDGKYVAKIGDYNPLTNPATINLDVKAYEEWLAKGAQPTNTVRNLYNKATGKPTQRLKTVPPKEKTEEKADQPEAEAKPAEAKEETKPAEAATENAPEATETTEETK